MRQNSRTRLRDLSDLDYLRGESATHGIVRLPVLFARAHGVDDDPTFCLLRVTCYLVLADLFFLPALEQVDAAAPATMIGYLLLSGVALGALRYLSYRKLCFSVAFV